MSNCNRQNNDSSAGLRILAGFDGQQLVRQSVLPKYTKRLACFMNKNKNFEGGQLIELTWTKEESRQRCQNWKLKKNENGILERNSALKWTIFKEKILLQKGFVCHETKRQN